MAYGGNDYDARFTIGKTDAFGAQGFTVDSFVHVESRAAVDGTLTPNNGALPTVGYADNGTTPSEYIDPYEFDLSAFRAEVEQITSVTVSINDEESGSVEKTFTTDGQGGYTLVWSFAGMAVNYLGGRVALIAQLTGPDGSTQNYEIDYLVTRKLVNNITGTKGGDWSSDVNTTVGSDLGRASTTYAIDPFTPYTQSLPTGWSVTFTLSNPVLEGGVVTDWTDAGTEEQSYSYITTIMPSTAAMTAENAANGKPDAGDVTMQIDGGQRIRIPVSITGKTTSANPTSSGNVLQSKVDGVTVVWHGTVSISYNNGNNTATYDVTFSDPTGADITVEAIEGRTASYTLTPYIGAVINAAGKVLDWNGDVPAANRIGTTVSFSV